MAYRRTSFGVAWGRTLDIERTAGLSLKARESAKQTNKPKKVLGNSVMVFLNVRGTGVAWQQLAT